MRDEIVETLKAHLREEQRRFVPTQDPKTVIAKDLFELLIQKALELCGGDKRMAYDKLVAAMEPERGADETETEYQERLSGVPFGDVDLALGMARWRWDEIEPPQWTKREDVVPMPDRSLSPTEALARLKRVKPKDE